MQIRIEPLIGKALDWAVTKYVTEAFCAKHGADISITGWPNNIQSFSTDWTLSGPILDGMQGLELKQWLESSRDNKCEAHIHNYDGDWVGFGPTILIAVMRCYLHTHVVSDTVEIPDEYCEL